jgi:hypothetical protein
MGGISCLAAGCGHMPVTTLYQLRKFDPASFDPAPMRIAVRLTDAVVPRKAGTVFRISTTIAGRTPEKVEEELVLEQLPVAAEPGLAAFRKSGEALHVFRFSPTDVERIRALQAEAKQAAGGRSGSNRAEITVSSKACRRQQLPAGALLSTTLLRTEADAPFLVLLQDVDLRAETQRHGKDIEVEIPPCE